MMRKIVWLGVGLCCVALSIAHGEETAPKKEDASEAVFGLTKVHKITLEISAKDFAALAPKGGGMPFGPGGPAGFGPPGAGAPGGGRPPGFGPPPGAQAPPPAGGFGPPPGAGRGPGGFGAGPRGGGGAGPNAGLPVFDFNFEYVHAAAKIGEQAFADVGVRYKGNATYMMTQQSAKRSFKVDLDRYEEKSAWHGVKKFNLHAGAFDGTKVKEALGYMIFRECGVPAPRTAMAEVTITVPEKFDQEYLGLYTLVEQVDKKFLKTHFKSSKGLLVKPEGLRGIPYLGEDAEVYKERLDGKTDGDEAQWQRLIAFAKLVNQASDEDFTKEIDSYLDTDAFVRFLAVNTLLVNYDSFMGMGHNYYMYLVPETNKFVFFPWDLDLAFGAHPMFGPMEQQVDMSISHPQMGEINLIDRLLKIPAMQEKLRKELGHLTDTVFTTERLSPDIAAIEAISKEPLAKEQKGVAARREGSGGLAGMGGGPFGSSSMPLTTFVQKRAESVKLQLAGKREGMIPGAQFGPGRPGGFGGGGFGGGPGGMIAKLLLNLGDTKKDGKLTQEELEAAVKGMEKWDKNSDGALDEKELEAAINSALPAPMGPPGFDGPPGFSPPGGR